MHLDIKLALGRNLIEATTTGVTLHVNDSQTVTGILTDTLERCEQTRLNLRLQVLHLSLQLLLLGTGLFHNLVELALLDIQVLTTVVDNLLILSQFLLLLLYAGSGLLDLLVAELNLQRLILNLLRQRVVLTIVLHIVQLSLVTLHAGLSGLNLALLQGHCLLKFSNIGIDFVHTRSESLDFIFKVLYFQRQFASQCTLLVDSRECGLQLKEGLQTLFNRHVHWVFLCHNSFLFVITLFRYYDFKNNRWGSCWCRQQQS